MHFGSSAKGSAIVRMMYFIMGEKEFYGALNVSIKKEKE